MKKTDSTIIQNYFSSYQRNVPKRSSALSSSTCSSLLLAFAALTEAGNANAEKAPSSWTTTWTFTGCGTTTTCTHWDGYGC